MSKHPCRRNFLKAGIGFIGGTGASFLFSNFEPAVAHLSPNWRYCVKCQSLFYGGSANRGVCPSGGGHQAAGYLFSISYNEPETPNAQNKWRECKKCKSMFYQGSPGSNYYKGGICPAGGTHTPWPTNFVIPHDIPETSTRQDKWRYCVKCQSMFYEGWPGSNYYKGGICPAGGSHQAAGFNFVLRYESTGNPPQNPPSQNPPSQNPPIINVELALIPGSFNQLRVSGGVFSASEQVSISVTTLINGQNRSTVTTPTTADSLGRINQTIGVTCVSGSISVFQVQARGVSSGRISNVSGASC